MDWDSAIARTIIPYNIFWIVQIKKKKKLVFNINYLIEKVKNVKNLRGKKKVKKFEIVEIWCGKSLTARL